MDTGKYQGVILAAGHGSRMGPFGEQLPKPIAPICNKPLLVYQLEHMRALGIEEVLIVIGHLGYLISDLLGDGAEYGVRIQYVEQKERLGLAHAVGQLEQHIDRPFLLILGDIFFEVPDLGQMVADFEAHEASAVLAVKEEDDIDAVKKNFAVLLREDETVRRVIEKPGHVENMLKGCGLYLFDLHIFDAIRRTPRTAMRDEYELTDSIQILIDYEYPVRIARVVEWDMNLTFTRDLITCCARQLAQQGVRKVVGEGCQIAEGTVLLDTVVGDGAIISAPVTLERCVVLPGAHYAEGRNLKDAIITQDGVLAAGDGD
jgi:dTDP-glucose pyrophosphorylase